MQASKLYIKQNILHPYVNIIISWCGTIFLVNTTVLVVEFFVKHHRIKLLHMYILIFIDKVKIDSNCIWFDIENHFMDIIL